MKTLYARVLNSEERSTLQQGLKAQRGSEVRRSQIILLSADEHWQVSDIARQVGLSGQQVRRVLHAFNGQGMIGLQIRSRARQDDQRAFSDAAATRLKDIVHLSPRTFGYDTSLWTLALLAAVSYREGLTEWVVHLDTISETLKRMGVSWQRAKHWIHSPDPHYATKKSVGIG